MFVRYEKYDPNYRKMIESAQDRMLDAIVCLNDVEENLRIAKDTAPDLKRDQIVDLQDRLTTLKLEIDNFVNDCSDVISNKDH
ncbi:MAG: hypothetical protein PUA61_06785 [Succinatimonas hippei]|nr:hypothetical protein [Succinatimonas hippei]